MPRLCNTGGRHRGICSFLTLCPGIVLPVRVPILGTALGTLGRGVEQRVRTLSTWPDVSMRSIKVAARERGQPWNRGLLRPWDFVWQTAQKMTEAATSVILSACDRTSGGGSPWNLSSLLVRRTSQLESHLATPPSAHATSVTAMRVVVPVCISCTYRCAWRAKLKVQAMADDGC